MPRYLIVIFICCSLFFSCKKTTPQLPSNKGYYVDEDITAMLAINKRLATQEDSLIKVFVNISNTHFAKSEIGFWYNVTNSTSNESVLKLGRCNYIYEISTLDGALLEKGKESLEFDKKQTIIGLEEGLKLLHNGESAIFIIPWYLGYGMKGKENIIPAYTTLIYKIKIDN